ncbi:hypothetical protein [Streptomyces sp. HUAS ZL42]|uniref:hypothetical protein n=1 Tax=Streptomyces sp. HUAS ZL42 TaxID=3231715 RepID=UPI00345ECC0D
MSAREVVDHDGQSCSAVSTPRSRGRLLPTSAPADLVFAAGFGGQGLEHRVRPPTVGPVASVTHIAALMARTHAPLVAVVERDGHRTLLTGAVTAARLMERLLGGP